MTKLLSMSARKSDGSLNSLAWPDAPTSNFILETEFIRQGSLEQWRGQAPGSLVLALTTQTSRVEPETF